MVSTDERPRKTDVTSRYRKRSCRALSCFGSPVSDTDAEKEKLVVAGSRKTSSWFSWSRFQKKKKTVPMDASVADESEDKAARYRHVKKTELVAEEGKKRRCQRSTEIPVAVPGLTLFQKLQKVSWKGGGSYTRPLREPPKAHVRESNRRSLLPAISAKYDTCSRPRSPANKPSKAGTSHPGSPATNPTSSSSSPVRRKLSQQTPGASRLSTMKLRQKNSDESARKRDSLAWLSVSLVVVLGMMILGGRIWAILCTSAWFYFLPWLRAPASDTGRGKSGDKNKSAVIDFNSVEYKKKVILEGLLERNGRKPAGIL